MRFEDIVEKYNSAPDLMFVDIKDVNTVGRYKTRLIHCACVAGDARDVEYLVNNGADVNAVGEDDFTPLHFAVEQGHLEVVKILLSLGADKNLEDAVGETPLDLAKSLNFDLIAAELSK